MNFVNYYYQQTTPINATATVQREFFEVKTVYSAQEQHNNNMFLPDVFLFIIALLISAALAGLFIYYVIAVSDLECDYMNAQQCCARLNQWVTPKAIIYCFVTCLLLLHGQWLLFICNLPMLIWMVYEKATVPPGNSGVYDPFEICQRGQISKHMRMFMCCFGYFLLWFFAYLYFVLSALLQGDPLNRRGEEEIEIDF